MLAAMCVLAVVAGCSQTDDTPQAGESSASSSPSARDSPARDAGKFFTWQQMHELGPQKQRIAKTVHAWEFYKGTVLAIRCFCGPSNVSPRQCTHGNSIRAWEHASRTTWTRAGRAFPPNHSGKASQVWAKRQMKHAAR